MPWCDPCEIRARDGSPRRLHESTAHAQRRPPRPDLAWHDCWQWSVRYGEGTQPAGCRTLRLTYRLLSCNSRRRRRPRTDSPESMWVRRLRTATSSCASPPIAAVSRGHAPCGSYSTSPSRSREAFQASRRLCAGARRSRVNARRRAERFILGSASALRPAIEHPDGLPRPRSEGLSWLAMRWQRRGVGSQKPKSNYRRNIDVSRGALCRRRPRPGPLLQGSSGTVASSGTKLTSPYPISRRAQPGTPLPHQVLGMSWLARPLPSHLQMRAIPLRECAARTDQLAPRSALPSGQLLRTTMPAAIQADAARPRALVLASSSPCSRGPVSGAKFPPAPDLHSPRPTVCH